MSSTYDSPCKSPCKARPSFFVQEEPRFYKEVYRTAKKIDHMHSDRDLLSHSDAPMSPMKLTAGHESDLNPRPKCASNARYGSALKPRSTQQNFFSESADRHERLNPIEKRKRMSQCQFTNSALKADQGMVTIPEQRPFSAMSKAKNQGRDYKQMKHHSARKERELAGSNTVETNEIKEVMRTLLQPTKDHRKKVLEAVLGSRQTRQALNHYRDNDVTTNLTNVKHTSFSTYKASMGPTIKPIARKAHHPYQYVVGRT